MSLGSIINTILAVGIPAVGLVLLIIAIVRLSKGKNTVSSLVMLILGVIILVVGSLLVFTVGLMSLAITHM